MGSKNLLHNFISHLVLLVISVGLTYYLTPRTYESLYCKYISNCGGGWVDYGPVLWMVASYTFLVTFLFMTFGRAYRYWWIGICLAPILFLILWMTMPPLIYISSFDFSGTALLLGAWGIYILAGLILGTIAHKTLQKLARAFMARLS
ncbi:MAG: hypothetical protein G01um10148_190 [Parcubacteria group bacterium Gr01-1014_8]|nr:MAG: hypothetical protein G01um10148_190 [Parcubacteria group bacterium Gr01-1014_8]